MIESQMSQAGMRIMVVITFCALLFGQTIKPERKVAGNMITSAREVRIELAKSVQYVGADRSCADDA